MLILSPVKAILQSFENGLKNEKTYEFIDDFKIKEFLHYLQFLHLIQKNIFTLMKS